MPTIGRGGEMRLRFYPVGHALENFFDTDYADRRARRYLSSQDLCRLALKNEASATGSDMI